MKCPECQFENREGAKFCKKCGTKLALKCPSCGSSYDPESIFCDECGYNLTQSSKPIPKELSFDEKLERIQKYLPGGLTEKILSQRGKIEGERKQVTVMFADMANFTPLVEKLGPEETYSIMDDVYEILIHKVHDYEGTVNEMTGDGIMALFGAPRALEDAPQRAIRSAYAIHREMVKFSDDLKKKKGEVPILKMRIGIHTGPVVIGALGNDLRVEFKAVGDTVNLASRMEGIAEPGTTYVTEEILKLTEGLFRYESLGEKGIKGKEESVKVYRVIGPSTQRTRFDVSAERGLTPFVGRERELELLLDGFERAKQGHGQAFSIISEAGVGKSRLIYEFRKTVANENVTFLEGKCLSYSQGVAYHPIIDLYKSNFDIRDNDSDNRITEKVRGGLKQLGIDEASALPYLLELLSVKESGINKISLSPEGKKDRMIETMIRIPLKGSEIRPLIMVIEDLHWMDRSSEDILKYVLESISGARILLIFSYRPDFVHTWGGKSYYNQLNLNRLTNRESLSMVHNLFDTEDIESELENLVLDKTDGVPFFIEEFIKSLINLKIIKKKDHRFLLSEDIQEVAIPSTIQDVIMARVDSLPENAKEVLQIGSVIEREFSHELIERSTDFSERELLSHLSVLKDVELLYERGIFPKSTYIFKHALTREVIYESILNKKKKQFHEEIGNAIEGLYKENINEYYAVLAEHFIEAESYEKGAKYSRLAARKSEKVASLFDAIAYEKKRTTCLEKLSRTEDVEKRIIDARTTLGLYLNQVLYHVEAKEAVEPIIELALERDYKRRISQIYTIMGAYYLTVEDDFLKAFHYLEDGLKIAEELNDILSLAMSNYWLAAALSHNCEFERSFQCFEKTLNINMVSNSLWGISIQKGNISRYIYNMHGQIDLGYKTSQEALDIAEESGDTHIKALANGFHGHSCYLKRFFKEAEEHLFKAIDYSEKINFYVVNGSAHMNLGNVYYDMGQYQESKLQFAKAILSLEQVSMWPSLINLNKIALVRSKVMMKEKDIDLESLYGYETQTKLRLHKSSMQRYIGEILLQIDEQHFSEAEDWIKKAIKADKSYGMRWNLGSDYALYAGLYKRKGNHSKAREKLSKGIEIFKECRADGWVEKYEKELAGIS